MTPIGSDMSDLITQELLDMAFGRLERLEARLKEMPQHHVTWNILRQEYEALYYEVANKDMEALLDREHHRRPKPKKNPKRFVHKPKEKS